MMTSTTSIPPTAMDWTPSQEQQEHQQRQLHQDLTAASASGASSSSSRCCVMDTFHALKRREEVYKVNDYLRRHNNTNNNTSTNSSSDMPSPRCGGGGGAATNSTSSCSLNVDADCRAKMISWGCTIVDHCNLSRETVEIASKLLDKMLDDETPTQTTQSQQQQQQQPQQQLPLIQDRARFQLAAVTCLYTAIKVHENTSIGISTMVTLGRSLFSVHDIQDMELRILRTNNWLLNPPTTYSFGRILASWVVQQQQQQQQQQHVHSQRSQNDRHHHCWNLDTLIELVNVQLDAALLDYDLSVFVPPSTVAVCAVQNAIEGMMTMTKPPPPPSSSSSPSLSPSLCSSSSSSSTSCSSPSPEYSSNIIFQRLCHAAGIDIMNDESTTRMMDAVMERLHVGLVETCTNRLSIAVSTQGTAAGGGGTGGKQERREKQQKQQPEQGRSNHVAAATATTKKGGTGDSSSSPKSVVPVPTAAAAAAAVSAADRHRNLHTSNEVN